MSKKKKVKQAGNMNESWLIPYADLLTLLLSLFIVLFASSQIDQKNSRKFPAHLAPRLLAGRVSLILKARLSQNSFLRRQSKTINIKAHSINKIKKNYRM